MGQGYMCSYTLCGDSNPYTRWLHDVFMYVFVHLKIGEKIVLTNPKISLHNIFKSKSIFSFFTAIIKKKK